MITALHKPPKTEKELVAKYKDQLSSPPPFSAIKSDFECPISGHIMSDPVLLNGRVYDREYIEDWIFENDWTDPGTQEMVSPDDIQECGLDFLVIHTQITT